MSYALLILGMAALTYAIRTTLFLLGDRLAFPPLLLAALRFVPVTVLTAIIVPMTLAPHGGDAELTWRNPRLVGAAAAVLVSAATRRPLVTIAAGLAVFFFWQAIVPPRGWLPG
ncbi:MULTISPECIES: AzlD domain-containing protein [Burkholderia]|uniref:Branched-chain amino acid transporter n=1 Tax=Burkholderia savannae TaxID=1637837 RepID=A0ABR5TEV6_9BURK|nr:MULTISPECIES: AzlD domain-containing protein [Burkholderia]AOJ68155.1 branched-chain amino acid transporter [Burkholderia savannae]AOJ80225.1 branched-chain amino acid transporter [Burkholderia savannae]AOK46450.1 branched-chain amino acid transporter [Burkholderia sp. MSMB617WGS]KGS07624.1 branched-chain amino acid transport family protein [Burkholderia sp. ABCPW 111]KVG40539.1 branched-chain amino acid transporter [Burkholderia sp. MSMB0265]